jgi:hypothetical protein
MGNDNYNNEFQGHRNNQRESNFQAVKESEYFFIYGDQYYIGGYLDPNSQLKALMEYAVVLKKHFVLGIDKRLPEIAQIFLRKICPKDNITIVYFNPDQPISEDTPFREPLMAAIGHIHGTKKRSG